MKKQAAEHQNKVKTVEDLIYGLAVAHDSIRKISDQAIESASSNDYKSGIEQWGVRGRKFLPSGKTIATLPSGWYKLSYVDGYGYVPELLDTRDDELIKLPIPEYGAVLDDIQRFWDSDAKYREFKFPYKRGILLYGHPGTGKSGLVRLLANDLLKQKQGVILSVGSPDEIHAFESVFTMFRELEPTRQVLCILEDIDNFARYGGSSYAKLLNILDGNMRYDGVVFLATTNFPDILLDSLANRPSRFDRRYEIGTPSEEARRVYVSAKFPALPKSEVERVVRVSEGYTIDGLKELVISSFVLGYDLEEVAAQLNSLFVYRGRIGDDVVGRGDSKTKKGLSDSIIYGYRTEIDNQLNR